MLVCNQLKLYCVNFNHADGGVRDASMANSIVPNSTHFVGAVEPTNSSWYRTSLELQFYMIDAFLGS